MHFSYSRTTLLTIDEPVSAPKGLVYSTSPRRAEGTDGRSYFIKGDDDETVFAEIGGCILTDAIGLPVPAVALCEFEGQWFAGSEDLGGIRDISAWLRDRDKIENLSDLIRIIAVDTWLANTDRNWGNLIGESAGEGTIRLFFIDFEKSAALRPMPLMTTAGIRSEAMWPRGELGSLIRGWGYLYPPADVMDRIASFSEERCTELLSPVAAALGIAWLESSCNALARRASQIRTLVEGVWNSK